MLKGQSSKSLEDYLMNEDTALLFARNGGNGGQSDDLPTFNGQIKVLVNGHNTCDESPTSSGGLIGNSEFTNICLDNSAGKKDGENGYDSPLYLVPNHKINSAPVTLPAPRQFPIPPLPQSFTQPHQPDASVNSEPENISDNAAVESKENLPFDSNSYKNAAQNFIDKAFSDKLEKLKLENEIKTFTQSNWGYEGKIFLNDKGEALSKDAIEFRLIKDRDLKGLTKPKNFELFLCTALDNLSYTSGGGIYRNYKLNSFIYLALARMNQGVSKEIVEFCKNYPSEGSKKNELDRDKFLNNLKTSGKINEYQKAFQDVFATF